MKKMIFKTLALFLCTSLQAQTTLEVRAGAFFHSSERFRDIYGDWAATYQLEANTPLYSNIDGWANFDWSSQHGRSIGFNDSTKIKIANISFGVKVPYQINEQVVAYLGIGPSFSKVFLRNDSQCGGHDSSSKWAYGAVLKSGVNYYITERIFVDLFLDYLYQPIHYHHTVDLGGVKAGLGIGVAF